MKVQRYSKPVPKEQTSLVTDKIRVGRGGGATYTPEDYKDLLDALPF